MLDFFEIPKLGPQPVNMLDDINTGIIFKDLSGLDIFFDAYRDLGIADLYEKLETDSSFMAECMRAAKIAWINKTSLEIFGADSKEELVNRWHECVLPETRISSIEYLIAIFEKRTECSIDVEFQSFDKRHVHVRSKSAFFGEPGRRMEICSFTDITDILTAKQQLKQIQSRYENALQETEIGVWEWNIPQNEIHFDAEYNRILGYLNQELNIDRKLVHRSIHPSDQEQTEALIADVRTGRRSEYLNIHRLKHAGGDYIWARSHGRVSERDSQGRPLRAVGTMCDVSSEIRNREFVKIERLIFQSSTSGIPIQAILNTVANRIETIYPEFRCAIHIFEASGQFIESCAAPSLGEAYPEMVVGFDVLNTCSACQKAVQTGTFVVVPDFQADPAFDIVSNAFSRFDIRGCGSIPILSSSEAALGTVCLYSRSTLHQSEIEQLGLERISRSLALVIEKDRQQERQSMLQQQAQNRQKFESLGQLAGGIAHDFNNLLLSVVCNAEMIQMQSSDDDESVQCADEIIRASTVAANICKQMLAFAGKAETTRIVVHIRSILDEISTLVRSAAPHAIQLEINGADDLPPISGDSSALSQVFINLLTNAVDAISAEHGKIQIETGVAVLDRDSLDSMVLGNKVASGSFVTVAVRDNGPGFDGTIGSKVFDPFFTTKQTGRGLGLATVLGIVEQHGGAIRVESEPGQGTCFTLYFPEQPFINSPAFDEIETITPVLCVSKKILVVDDHQFIRQSLQKNFEAEGCEIAVAECGRSAIELMQNEEFDYVLLDQMMPGLDGLETYRRIREFKQTTPICFMTGYAANTEIEKTVDTDPNAKLIRKPFQRQELMRLIAAE